MNFILKTLPIQYDTTKTWVCAGICELFEKP